MAEQEPSKKQPVFRVSDELKEAIGSDKMHSAPRANEATVIDGISYSRPRLGMFGLFEVAADIARNSLNCEQLPAEIEKQLVDAKWKFMNFQESTSRGTFYVIHWAGDPITKIEVKDESLTLNPIEDDFGELLDILESRRGTYRFALKHPISEDSNFNVAYICIDKQIGQTLKRMGEILNQLNMAGDESYQILEEARKIQETGRSLQKKPKD